MLILPMKYFLDQPTRIDDTSKFPLYIVCVLQNPQLPVHVLYLDFLFNMQVLHDNSQVAVLLVKKINKHTYNMYL